jgi:branched-chain amino acid transport system substrate-binding protein
MRRAILLLVALTLAVFGGTLPASAAKRVALVIGVDAYDNLPTLQKAVNDEKAVASALTGLGFDVVSGENVTRREMNAKLAELDAKIAPGDTVFFFFAGHGVALGGENYLLLRDLPKPRDGEENLVRDEGHAVDAIVRRVQGRGAAVSFFVLDACRDNPLAATGTRGIGGTRGLTRAEAPSGVFMLFSAGIGETALDRLSEGDPDPNSVFTRKLVPLLKTPGLTQIALAKRVQKQVNELAATVRHPQLPAFYDQIIDEIELSPAGAAVASPPPSVEPSVPVPAPPEVAQVLAPKSEPSAPEQEVAVVAPPSAPVAASKPVEPVVVTVPKPELPAIAADTALQVAVVGPFTGTYASLGAELKNGAEMAVADINAEGGVLGRQIDLNTADDACDPKQAVEIANQLAATPTKFIAGHYCSGSSIPASKVYAGSDLVQISPASTNPIFTDDRAGPNIFRVVGRDDQQGGFAGRYLASHFAGKRIAIVHDKTAYGKGLADDAKETLNQAGKREAMYEAITAGEKDYSALVNKLNQAKIDVVYFGGYHTEAGLIIRQMRDRDLRTILMGGDALLTQEFWSITGDAGQGTLMTFSPDPRKNPAAAEVVKRFKERGVEPEGYVLYTYAAFQAWKQAAEKARSVEKTNIVKAMNDTEFDTVIGRFRFNERGDPSLPPYAAYRWSNATYDEID